MSKSERLTEIEIPEWYGKHDNPHHEGKRAQLRKIAKMEDELFEYTGIRGKHFSSQQGRLKPPKLTTSELMEGIEPST